MLGFSYILAALCLASVVSSTGILVPLYSWPEDNSTWSPVFNAADAHPDILFQVIVNPDSGPGDTSTISCQEERGLR
jgi:Spherulation-specific family 4.